MYPGGGVALLPSAATGLNNYIENKSQCRNYWIARIVKYIIKVNLKRQCCLQCIGQFVNLPILILQVADNSSVFKFVKESNMIIARILWHGSETWTTNRRQEHGLNVFHMRCFRSIMRSTANLEGSYSKHWYPSSNWLQWHAYHASLETSLLDKPRSQDGQIAGWFCTWCLPSSLCYRDVIKMDI